ncbi:hypothetical protein [Kitasatospora sp. NPDC088346]|uniref:hypothetical protein n=1 Tax=Kitasatospora sp. NPDC088346 TaxID=3364073 RepID=UPI0038204F61
MPVPLSGLAAALAPIALLPAAAAPPTVVDGRFAPASAFVPPAAISHAQDLVPYGSHVRVTVVRGGTGTTVLVELAGVASDHTFPAHVHTGRCGADPAASGPHYQDHSEPARPSAEPALTDPTPDSPAAGRPAAGRPTPGNAAPAEGRGELRLTVHTDATGAGRGHTTVPWGFRPNEAHALVLHAGDGAGPHAAGDRAACVNVDF